MISLRRCSGWVGALSVAAVLALPPSRPLRAAPAAADSDDSVRARALYEKGMAHYHLEEYDQAIEKWEEGFRLRPAPEFLYNIAQSHRLAHRADKALSFYQKYLRLAPRAQNRAEVERHIAALEKIVREAPAPETPATPATPVAPAAPPPPVVVETPAPAAAPAASANAVTAAPAKKPIYKRGWFWGVIGGSIGVVLVAGVVAGVLVARHDQPQSLPAVRF